MMCLTCGKVQLNRSLIYILAAQLRGAHKFSLLSSCFAYSLVLTASVFRVSHGGDVYARRWCLSIGARFQYLLLSHTIIICMPSARNNVCFFSSCWFTKVVKQCEGLSRSKATFRETNPRVSLHISQPPHNWIQVCILTVYCILTRSCLKFCGTICNLIYILLLWYLVPTSIVGFFLALFYISLVMALSTVRCKSARFIKGFGFSVTSTKLSCRKATRSIETHQTIFKRSATRSQTVCKLCHSSAMKSSSFWHSVQKIEMILNYVVFQCGFSVFPDLSSPSPQALLLLDLVSTLSRSDASRVAPASVKSCQESIFWGGIRPLMGLSWPLHTYLLLSPDLMSKRTQQEQGLLLQGGVFAFIAFAILEKLDETEWILVIKKNSIEIFKPQI